MRGDILVGRFRGRDCAVCFEYRGGALSFAVFDRINVLAEEPEVRLKQIVYRAHTNTNTRKTKQQPKDNTPRKLGRVAALYKNQSLRAAKTKSSEEPRF